MIGPCRRLVPASLALALFGMLVAAGTARAQIDSREGIALQNQILELRHDLEALRSQPAGGSSFLGGAAPAQPSAGGAPDEISAQLLERVQQLEDAVRQLRGRIDEIANQAEQQNADLTKQIGDLNFRLQSMPGGGTPGAPAAAPPGPAGTTLSPPPVALGTVPAAPAAPPPPAAPQQPGVRRTPELALQEGNAALARRDYPAAEAAAREVLGSGRASPRAYDAQFLLAQALTGKRDWSQAAIAYDDAYSRARTGSHAQDALVGLAGALTAIGEKKAACQTLDKLRTEFPQPRGEVRDQAAATRLRAGCH